ncbi:hypothetical protein ACIB24_08500 [Spongisporangium articulatum]|uniref:Lipoprotein LpqN n=1 Tax=Spongisporangium articulatum TaxID=3362603 RepID=A0ABW8AL56_9ACTN
MRVDPGAGVALVALEPPTGDFRASLVVTADALNLNFRDWQATTDRALPAALAEYQLIDLERRPFAGADGGRRLAHHVAPGGAAVTMEQWFTVRGGVGYTLTASVGTANYANNVDVLAEIADGVTFAGEGQ